jgi:hypothetical protein
MKQEIQFIKDYTGFSKNQKWKGSRDIMAIAVKKGFAKYVEDMPKPKQSIKPKSKPKK